MPRNTPTKWCTRTRGPRSASASAPACWSACSPRCACARGTCGRPLESRSSRPTLGNAMKISMYQASAPRFVNALSNLSAILDKAQAHFDAKKVDAAVPGTLRLIADMFPLARQVQIACDTAKGATARLAGMEIPPREDTEKTLAELKARIAWTIDFVAS